MNLINKKVEQLTNESADEWDPSFHPSGSFYMLLLKMVSLLFMLNA